MMMNNLYYTEQCCINFDHIICPVICKSAACIPYMYNWQKNLPLQNGVTSYNSTNRKWKYACDGWPHCPRDNPRVPVIFKLCVVFSRARIAFPKNSEVEHRICFLRPNWVLACLDCSDIGDLLSYMYIPESPDHDLPVALTWKLLGPQIAEIHFAGMLMVS